jgi:transmembrane sensor
MSDEGTPPATGDQLRDEASLWFARMRGPEAEQHRPEFDAWLARGAAHRGAYMRMAEVFSWGKCLVEPPKPTRHRMPLPALVAGIAALGACFTALLLQVGAPQSGRMIAPVALAPARAPAPLQTAPLQTDRAPRRFTLADGSVVILEPNSRVELSFSASLRSLRLRRGAARFEVAHDGRAFVVSAGGGTVTALGTVFDVALRPESGVSVHLIRGSVDVAVPQSADPGARTAGLIRRLAPGEAFAFVSLDALPSAGRALPLPLAVAGSMAVDGISLGDLIAQINLAGAGPKIVLGSQQLAALRVSGRFRTGDPQALAAKLAGLFALDLDRSRPGELVLRDRADGPD